MRSRCRIAAPTGRSGVLIASSEKIRRELGWEPKVPDVESIVASAWQCIEPPQWHTQIMNSGSSSP